MKVICVALFLVFTFVAPSFADPKPLGFELGKASYSQMASKYEMVKEKPLPGMDVDVYEINPKSTGLRYIEKVTAIFNKKSLLMSVIMIYPRTYFDSLYRQLVSKYKVIYSHLPVVGTKYVRFIDGNTIIILKQPYLKYTTTVIYVRKELLVPPR
ncbi:MULTISPECIES: hypothetical protein [unclassified Desulfurobacterium]|uniref:hypothetical protein n=1 Tax=Desulfurobacterium sp. TC5-1 TaxID=1158318 RepID=UPI0003B469F1|nr:hypothetical protein [Desulfurobacterium sp. TC5-1]